MSIKGLCVVRLTKPFLRVTMENMGFGFFHVDLDAFFASVEQHDNPDLKGKPVIVGARPGHRGVVSTCSYEARKFGLHSAMPISEAFRLCPEGIFLPVRMQRYTQVSRKIMGILLGFTPDMIQLSIDEALLDMNGTERLWGNPEKAAGLIKQAIGLETGLSISIGVSCNAYVAKIASGLKKPNGLTIVPKGEEKNFMAALPLERLWGAGEKTRVLLRGMGLMSVSDIQRASFQILESKLGKASAAFLRAAADGKDPGIRSISPKRPSISAERTFEKDRSDREFILDTLRLLSDELAGRIVHGSTASTLVLKLRFSDFSSIHRQFSRQKPFLSSDELFETAKLLLDKNWNGLSSLRLIGLGLSGLKAQSLFQEDLFQEEISKSELARRAAQEIDSRGLGHLVRARFMAIDKENREE